ncbi:helix-turn-helix transcriptional regulator [Naumannella sp. ID2617S]|nr:helix-turn-helix transcriptional regulator [Naumannella sp. ID2617S]
MDTWSPKVTSTKLGVVTDTERRIRVSAAHRDVLGQVLDKWSIHVLEELCECPRRFNELRRLIPVSQKSLSTTLRRLERNGIVERHIIKFRPLAVEYRITALGKTLREPVQALLSWSEQQIDVIEAARARFDQEDPPQSAQA